ncbi:hypothetical protein R9C00_18025 [Flammeovirgaceae bacterium SG7u.111]|nr:hypothetical protein [Flammeovirgaceae bacterium SG7u.132]WPO33603.1 hypothetical protein R9C00_18025 [Flammeovirgaceae bacterium SG7u.111]
MEAYQIELHSIKVDENGTLKEGAEGKNIISVTMFYPRPGVPALTSIRTVELKDGEVLKFSGKFLNEKLLFKETIVGDTPLIIELSAVEEVEKIDKFMVKLLKSVAVAAIGAVTGIGAVLTAVATVAVNSIFDVVENDTKDTIHKIGQNELVINNDTEDGIKSVNLIVPKTIELTSKGKNNKGETVIKKFSLNKGKANAEVKLRIKKIKLQESKTTKNLMT